MDQKTQSRTERKKEETRSRIITAAVGLFNRYGFEAVTMEQIAEEVDIAKGTLYNYFPAKEAIINAFIQHTFEQRNDDRIARLRSLPDTRSRLTAVFRVLIEGVQAQKDIFEAFMVYRMKQVTSFKPVAEAEQSGLTFLIHEIIELGQASHELRTDLPEDHLAGLFEYALIAAIRPLYLDPAGFDADKSITRCVDLFLKGAKA
jgi:AcrR family transcriptional regulator